MKVGATLGTAVLAITLAACGGGSSATKSASAPTPSASPSAAAGPATFLTWAHGADYGTKDFAGAPDDALLNFGNTICQGFSDTSLSYGSEVQALTEAAGSPTTEQAQAMIDHAVPNLCPEYASRLP